MQALHFVKGWILPGHGFTVDKASVCPFHDLKAEVCTVHTERERRRERDREEEKETFRHGMREMLMDKGNGRGRGATASSSSEDG